MTVTDATPRERRNRQHEHNAIDVIETALLQSSAVLGRYRGRLDHRRAWLTSRLNSP